MISILSSNPERKIFFSKKKFSGFSSGGARHIKSGKVPHLNNIKSLKIWRDPFNMAGCGLWKKSVFTLLLRG